MTLQGQVNMYLNFSCRYRSLTQSLPLFRLVLQQLSFLWSQFYHFYIITLLHCSSWCTYWCWCAHPSTHSSHSFEKVIIVKHRPWRKTTKTSKSSKTSEPTFIWTCLAIFSFTTIEKAAEEVVIIMIEAVVREKISKNIIGFFKIKVRICVCFWSFESVRVINFAFVRIW